MRVLIPESESQFSLHDIDRGKGETIDACLARLGKTLYGMPLSVDYAGYDSKNGGPYAIAKPIDALGYQAARLSRDFYESGQLPSSPAPDEELFQIYDLKKPPVQIT